MTRTKREIQKLLADIATDTSTPDYIQDKADKILNELLSKFENEIVDQCNRASNSRYGTSFYD
jgi:hypothetical protein